MASCRNCGTAVVPDPTDSEFLVHSWSQDAQCVWYGQELDSWAEGPSEVEKQQAKMRLVRYMADSRFDITYLYRPVGGLDTRMRIELENKQDSLKSLLHGETIAKLLKGEDAD